MSPRVVLVTGVALDLAARLAGVLAADPAIERVLGVDTVAPRAGLRSALGRTEFVRVDVRSTAIGRVVAESAVDTVLHLGVAPGPVGAGQLLAACQQAPLLRRLVLRSTGAVYGSSPQDPAVFAEQMQPATPRSGDATDAVEVEGHVRAVGRRRPDVAVTILRFAELIGPRVDTPLSQYFALPVVPTVLGFDPRLQFCHEDDALEVLRLAATEDRPGTFNVAGSGVLLLSQAIRRSGRLTAPVPAPAVGLLTQQLRRAGGLDVSAAQVRYLEHGRVLDTTRLRKGFGYTPAYSTTEAFEDFLTARGLRSSAAAEGMTRLQRELVGLLDRVRCGLSR